MMLLQVKVKPAVEPVSLVELKEYLRVSCDNEDNLLKQLIAAARRYCEEYQHRAYMNQTLELFCMKNACVELPRSEHLQEVVSVETYEGVPLTDYSVVRNLNAMLIFNGRNDAGGYIRVKYITGVDTADDVEENVKLAIMQLACHWYENRLPVSDGRSVAEMPYSVKALLAPGEVVTI